MMMMGFCYPVTAGCPVLTDPTNGAVVSTGTSPGSTATYTCNTGYKLEGQMSRTCGADIQWTPGEPVCLGK